jgi:hypothetical protein
VSPEAAQEAEQAAVLFHGALVALGAQAVGDSLALWQDVPPLPNVTSTRAVERWLATAVRYVMRRRIRARDLALAYYRYERALVTGKTIALPGQDNPPFMSLPELKRSFTTALNPDQASPSPEDNAGTDHGDQIPVEPLDGLDGDLARLDQQTEQQVRENLLVLGPLNQDRKTRGVRYVEPDQVDQGRGDAHDKAGNRQAAAAARNVMNGARSTLFLAADRDRRALGFVRVSRTGTPCGFCAMLISRGPVLKSSGREASLYRSNEGTGPKADGTIVTYGDMDLYHDNCQCYAVPVFSLQQFESDRVFALNRKYAELWPIVTKGLGGDAAITAWRRFIRQEARSRKAQEAAA